MIGGEYTDKSDRIVQTKMMMRYLEAEDGREASNLMPRASRSLSCSCYSSSFADWLADDGNPAQAAGGH